jgi:hypothetical protein
MDGSCVTSSTSGRRWLDSLEGKWKRDGARKFCGRGGSRVSGKERRVKFGREKKKGKRNDPGKAQSINGCGAEVKYCWVFLVWIRPGPLYFSGARGGSCELRDRFHGKR